jgi:hypothetical protein
MSEVRQHLTPNQSVQQYQVEEPICIGAPVVSAIGETEVLERIVIDLADFITGAIGAGILPVGFTGDILEAVVLTKRVTITDCEVFQNKVIVNGCLHKDILFKIAPAGATPPPTTIFPNGADCTITFAETVDVVIDCPIAAVISVPGACPGDQCEVVLACVEAERDLLIDTDGDGTAELFEEKVAILIRVKTIRQQLVTIQPVANICPTFPTTTPCPTSPCGTTTGTLPTTTLVFRTNGCG